MSPLSIPRIECVESKDSYSRFSVEPLEKGVGITLGNALRRMLLGYLPGAAVTSVKIEGIQHEFSTIPYAKEDTIEFLLNVKTICLKANSDRPGKLILDVNREGKVYASDIQPSDEFDIVNPDLYLITLDSPEARLYVEFNIELGEGYRQADSNANLPIGVIPVDAIFTPIRKVNFTTEPVHIGRETSRERMYLEVWTDGTITPTEAVSHSAALLLQQLTPFVNLAQTAQMQVEKKTVAMPIPDEKLNIPVEDLDLSVRTMNSLRRGGITTVGDLVSRGEKELLTLRNFGQKSRQEVEERLKSLGLSLNISGKDKDETAFGEDNEDSENEEEE
ncbi:MAG: DNA-directed RNA polymerase subunit alpha [Dehalococcoidales bacterium]|nr:DNA-directed RNA polymerase subunit alpha [Dehalococcoidales bacterium]